MTKIEIVGYGNLGRGAGKAHAAKRAGAACLLSPRGREEMLKSVL